LAANLDAQQDSAQYQKPCSHPQDGQDDLLSSDVIGIDKRASVDRNEAH
jgi:hypothetical protein